MNVDKLVLTESEMNVDQLVQTESVMIVDNSTVSIYSDESDTSNSVDEIVKTEIKLFDSSFGIMDSNIDYFTPVVKSERVKINTIQVGHHSRLSTLSDRVCHTLQSPSLITLI
uniref:Uncharacterized protein n=1 Tax=Timema poppense TaxID=170557 RepID=A0A7R9HC28_TIMPO|nr:unnamed protein product [Timema poppensis]